MYKPHSSQKLGLRSGNPTMVRTALIFFAGVLFAVGEVEARQDKVPKQSATPKPVMSVGLLAITTDHQGVLFIDGERRGIVSPGEVVSMKVVAGQHFVDLRDANGSKLWDKVVTIPPNTQVVEKIEYVRELDERDEQSLTDRILPPGPNIRTEEVAKYCTEPDDLAAKLANAGACADVLYDRGENQKALAKANQAIQGTEQIDHDIRSLGQEPITNDSEQLGAMYLLRARIQYALSNESGALSDLRTSLDYLRGYRQFVQKLATLAETATPELREKAKVFQQFLASPDPYVIQVHITRALILYRMASYAEALNDYNEYRVMVSTTGRENVVAKRLGDLIKKRIADATSAGEVATPSAPQLPSDNQESDIRRE